MKLRGARYRDTEELFEETAAAPSKTDETLRMDLEAALKQLNDTARAVVWLHDVEGYTHEDIAELMGEECEFLEVAIVAGTRAVAQMARRGVVMLIHCTIDEPDCHS